MYENTSACGPLKWTLSESELLEGLQICRHHAVMHCTVFQKKAS